MCAAPGDTNFSDECAASGARGILLAEYLKVVCVVTSVTASVCKMLKGGAADFDRVSHHCATMLSDGVCLGLGYSICSTTRSYGSVEECLVDVDVTEASDKRLV